MSYPKAATLVQLVEHHVRTRPDADAYTFLEGSSLTPVTISFGELYKQAVAVAATLQARGVGSGDPVLVLHAAGLDYVVALLGCLLSGAVAVPTYPPNRRQLARAAERIAQVARDAGAVAALGAKADLQQLQVIAGLRDVQAIATADADGLGAAYRAPNLASESGAILQYTSGSTAAPRGILLSHENLLANEAQLQAALDTSQRDVFVSWLPPFHDMGLLGSLLHPLFLGTRSILMAPEAFIRRPIRWLDAASRYGATILVAPNFAYDLCVRRVAPERRTQLDLSPVRRALTGSEPIDARTLARFADAFAPAGFRHAAFYPCYGLAEASLFVTGGGALDPVTVSAFDDAGLDLNLALPTPDRPGARRLVACGQAARDTELLIVDPDTRRPLPPRNVGEIWLRGPSIAAGYWRKEDATLATFGATLESGGPTYLRTGDLGFLHDGQLYVTGRRKELLIIRGRNHYPHDLERTVQSLHPALVENAGAAFAVTHDGRDELVIVQELDRRDGQDPNALLQRIPEAIAEAHDIAPIAVVLIKRGALDKTASGKVQRNRVRARLEAGELQVLARFDRPGLDAHAPATHSDGPAESAQGGAQPDCLPGPRSRPTILPPPPEAVTSPNAAQRADGSESDRARPGIRAEQDVFEFLLSAVADKARLAPTDIDPSLSLAHYGIDSLTVAELTEDVEAFVGCDLPPTFTYDNPSVLQLVRAIMALQADTPATAPQQTRHTQPSRGRAGERAAQAAVVGIGCRFPQADSPARFWDLLVGRVDAVTQVPPNRWDPAEISSDHERDGASMGVGGFLAAIDHFDPDFFGISQREAERMDPQQRLFLEVAWEALEDAGIDPRSLSGSDTGVFVGACSNDYVMLYGGDLDLIDGDYATGNATSVIANRLSYCLNLRGPSQTVDTACSSSLVALQQACDALERGDCDLAIVGGVNVLLSPETHVALARARALSPSGRCRAFSEDADGFVRSEGVGVLVLRRLGDAGELDQRVRAVIAGAAVNHSGQSNGLMAPSAAGQQRLLRRALSRARIAGEDIDFVEAHGVGSPVSDVVEMQALKAVVGAPTRPSRCWVGSVKANLGHLEAASGMAAVIKTILALEHELIPPQLHFAGPHPKLALGESAIAIPTTPIRWPRTTRTRYAGVSAFGLGGTNAHVIVREAPPPAGPVGRTKKRPHHLALLSARDEAALTQRVRQLLWHSQQAELGDICRTLNVGRAHFGERIAIVADDQRSLTAQLEALLPAPSGRPDRAQAPVRGAGRAFRGRQLLGRRPRIALVFGDGAFSHAAARALYDTLPQARAVFTEVTQRADPGHERELRGALTGDLPPAHSDAVAAAVARFATQQALYRLVHELGIEPVAIAGYGQGEYSAACAAGALGWDTALSLVAARAETLASLQPHAEIRRTAAQYRDAVADTTFQAPYRPVLLAQRHVGTALADHFQRKLLHESPCDASALDWSGHPVDLRIHIGSCTADGPSETDLELLPASETDPWRAFMNLAAALYTQGADLRWQALDDPFGHQLVALPSYPFQRRRCWMDFPTRQLAFGERVEQSVEAPAPIAHPLLRATRRVTRRRSGFIRKGSDPLVEDLECEIDPREQGA